MELPIECWELIFSNLHDNRRFEPVSLVSKQFLALTNRLRSFLKIPDHAPAAALLSRFPNLRSIDLSSYRLPADDVLLQISRSCPKLESLDLSNQKTVPLSGLRAIGSSIRSLKVLIMSELGSLEDRDLVDISILFPSLEELDIRYSQIKMPGQVSDTGVAVLSSNLKRLRKINISGDFFLSDLSIAALSRNCESLLEVAMKDCSFITYSAIASLIQKMPNLVSLSFDAKISPGLLHCMSHPFRCAKALRSLDVSSSYVSDILLLSIAEADIPLKEIALARSIGFTFHGIFMLLKAHPTVEILDLGSIGFVGITDQDMNGLCPFLGNLSSINLSYSSNLGIATLYNLIKSCPNLKSIKMEKVKIQKQDLNMFGAVKNSQLRFLWLAKNANLSDECLEKIVGACPNLETLNVSHCPNITSEGIKTALRSCSDKIMHLEISHCKGIKGLEGLDFNLPWLEVLNAKGLEIGCHDLGIIGKRCYNLVRVDLQGCLNVSDEGVKKLVRHCRGLREINLKLCDKVSSDCVSWMVFSRPSLRKIAAGPRFVPSENMTNFFLRHGCLVS